jgi:hypothetical protein
VEREEVLGPYHEGMGAMADDMACEAMAMVEAEAVVMTETRHPTTNMGWTGIPTTLTMISIP